MADRTSIDPHREIQVHGFPMPHPLKGLPRGTRRPVRLQEHAVRPLEGPSPPSHVFPSRVIRELLWYISTGQLRHPYVSPTHGYLSLQNPVYWMQPVVFPKAFQPLHGVLAGSPQQLALGFQHGLQLFAFSLSRSQQSPDIRTFCQLARYGLIWARSAFCPFHLQGLL